MTKRYCAVNDWLLDVPTGSLVHLQTGERKRLGEYQLKLLDILTQHAGNILSRDELTNMVWEGRFIGNNSLPNAIHALRVALEDDGKQQRIIRTIQKKGYILDAQYCLFRETSDLENGSESEPSSGSDDLPVAAQPFDATVEASSDVPEDVPTNGIVAATEASCAEPTVAEEHTVINPATPAHHRWLKLGRVCAALVLFALAGWTAFSFYGARYTTGVDIEVVQQERNSFSNINLYKLSEKNDRQTGDDGIYSKLKETLYTLNQEIKAKKAHLNIYYHVNEQALNYTFSIENDCNKRQLAMTIYHWRINNQQLNNVIYRETERRLNELSDCTP